MSRKIGMVALAFFILQVYFVRALLAAELLFVLLFATIFTLVAVSYVLGLLAEFAWDSFGSLFRLFGAGAILDKGRNA